jgi:hypothetical protein
MFMASPNEYHGYVKLPKKKLSKDLIRLDFNGHVDVQPRNASLRGFSLRMSIPGKNPEDDHPEISVTLTPEQWLDLIDAMKAEFESVQKARKNFEDLQ